MALPSSSQLLAEQLKQKMMAGTKADRSDLYLRIKEGTVIPIIGNALRTDGIFDWYFAADAVSEPAALSARMTVDDHLAHTWAVLIEYPLPDTTNLARVALYNRVRSKDDEEARVKYLTFLKNILLLVASNDPQVSDQVPDLQDQVETRTFSELVTELDYPHLDFNNDTWPDIFTSDMLPADNKRLKLLYGPESYMEYALEVMEGFYHSSMRNMLQLNNGNGTFSEIGQTAGVSNTDWSWAPLFADYDNDGWKDLFVTNGYFKDYTNRDFLSYKFRTTTRRFMVNK